jgi:hypothetical protein
MIFCFYCPLLAVRRTKAKDWGNGIHPSKSSIEGETGVLKGYYALRQIKKVGAYSGQRTSFSHQNGWVALA